MRKRLALFTLIVLASLVAAVAAWAGFPNFQRYTDPELVYLGSTSKTLSLAAAAETGASELSDPRVYIEKIVVVGVREGAATSLTAPYEAVYVCVNGGNNVPSAANKVTLVGQLSANALFPAAKNGKAEGSLLTGPLPTAAEAAASTGFTCPSGQVLEFDRVIFSGLVLAIEGGERVELGVTLVSASLHGLT
jgi:hypothetical protein